MKGGPETTFLYITGGNPDVLMCPWEVEMLKGLVEEAFWFPALHNRELGCLMLFYQVNNGKSTTLLRSVPEVGS